MIKLMQERKLICHDLWNLDSDSSHGSDLLTHVAVLGSTESKRYISIEMAVPALCTNPILYSLKRHAADLSFKFARRLTQLITELT